jgi:hypothetical protein
VFTREKDIFHFNEDEYSRENLQNLILSLIALKTGGTMMMRMGTFLTPYTVSLISFMTNVFAEVKISKPLACSLDTPDIYLVGIDYNPKLFLRFSDDLINFWENHSSSEEIVPSQALGLASLSTSTIKSTSKTSSSSKAETQNPMIPTPAIKKYLNYIAYRIFVLNMIPKLQINLDLYSNALYTLSPMEMTTYDVLIHKKDVLWEDQAEVDKITKDIKNLHREIVRRITEEDFTYILRDTAENWIKMMKIKI